MNSKGLWPASTRGVFLYVAVVFFVGTTLTSCSAAIASPSPTTIATRAPTPIVDQIAIATLDFWSKAKPLVDRYVVEVGRPLANLILSLGPQLHAGNPAAQNEFTLALQKAYPTSSELYLKLSDLRPPPGIAAQWHQAQRKYWGMRLNAIGILVGQWDFVRHGFTGTQDELEVGGELWDGSMLEGEEAERLQAEMLQWLAQKIPDGR